MHNNSCNIMNRGYLLEVLMNIQENNRAFTLVEIVVSMVILSIVVLVMTNTIIVSNKGHSSAETSGNGAMLAREKLSQLQDPDSAAMAGSDTVVMKNISYYRNWTISSTKPYKITVTVNWNNAGRERTSKIAGYLETESVCQSISPNHTPTAILYYDNSGALITEDTIKVGEGTLSGTFIAKLYGVDSDTSLGDIVRLFLTSSALDNAYFKLSGDTLYCDSTFTQSDTTYNFVVGVKDCAGQIFFDTMQLFITPPTAKPSAPNPQNISVYENRVAGETVGQLQVNAGVTGYSWTGFSSIFDVSSDGVITLSSVGNLDYETSASETFSATVSKDGKDSTVTVNITILDTNEAPTAISLSGNSVTEDDTDGTIVGTLTTTDPDHGTNTAWYTHYYLKFGGSTNFVVSGDNVKVASGANLSQGVEQIIIKSTDDNGTGLYVIDTFDITINGASTGCRDIAPWVNQSYSSGAVVSHINYVWFRTTDWDANPEPYLGSKAWNRLVSCSIGLCSDFPEWQSGTTYGYNGLGEVVSYDGNLYVHKEWTKGDVPSSSSKWTNIGACNE